MRVLGVLFTVFGFILIFVWVFAPVMTEDVHPLYAQIFCREGEELAVRSGPSSDGGTSYTFHCEDDDRRSRDVSAIMILSGMGVGMGILFTGVFMLVGFRRRASWVGDVATSLQQHTSGATWTQAQDGVIRVGGVEIRMDQAGENSSSVFQMRDDLSLAESLRQLEEARKDGLVTLVEYDRLRRNILARFEDQTDGK